MTDATESQAHPLNADRHAPERPRRVTSSAGASWVYAARLNFTSPGRMHRVVDSSAFLKPLTGRTECCANE